MIVFNTLSYDPDTRYTVAGAGMLCASVAHSSVLEGVMLLFEDPLQLLSLSRVWPWFVHPEHVNCGVTNFFFSLSLLCDRFVSHLIGVAVSNGKVQRDSTVIYHLACCT